MGRPQMRIRPKQAKSKGKVKSKSKGKGKSKGSGQECPLYRGVARAPHVEGGTRAVPSSRVR
jgi:hypothetical protein